jgi:hypothetical protein
VANSRFAAAAAADSDYQDRGQRDRGDDRGFGGRDDYDRRGGRDDNDRRGGGGGYDRGGYGGRSGDGDNYDRPSQNAPKKSSVSDLLKPKAPPVLDNILKVPTKEHADNMFKAPTKGAPKVELKPESTPAPEEDVAKVVDDSKLLAEFVSGKRLGADLKSWCSEQVIPSVQRLVFHMLTETEKLNPDPECGWAASDKYGAALVSLVEDDVLKQMEVLFGIQQYCDKLGWPKLNEEYVVQSMYRAMYKFDLATDDAFEMWKEDESDENNTGKVTAVIQTVDWFNWLEEDDDDEEDDYEEE